MVGGSVIITVEEAWREVDTAERLLVRRQFNKAAECAATILTKLKRPNDPNLALHRNDGSADQHQREAAVESQQQQQHHNSSDDNETAVSMREEARGGETLQENERDVQEGEWSALATSAGMVIVQAHHESGRDGDSVKAMRDAFTSFGQVPQEVLFAWACLLVSSREYATAKLVLEEYLFAEEAGKDCVKEESLDIQKRKVSSPAAENLRLDGAASLDDRPNARHKKGSGPSGKMGRLSQQRDAAIWEVYLIHVLAKGFQDFTQAEARLLSSDAGSSVLENRHSLQSQRKQALLDKLRAVQEENDRLKDDEGGRSDSRMLRSSTSMMSSKRGPDASTSDVRPDSSTARVSDNIGASRRREVSSSGGWGVGNRLRGEEQAEPTASVSQPLVESDRSSTGRHVHPLGGPVNDSRQTVSDSIPASERLGGRVGLALERAPSRRSRLMCVLELWSSWMVGIAMQLVSRTRVWAFPAMEKWRNWFDLKGAIVAAFGLVFAYALSMERQNLSRSLRNARTKAGQYAKDAWGLAFNVNLNPVGLSPPMHTRRSLTGRR